MARNEDYGLESLISATEKTLSDLGSLERLTADLPEETAEPLRAQIRKEQSRSLEETYGLRADGYVQASVSEDAMTAVMDLYPPREGGRLLEPGDVQAELETRGIVSGIDQEALLDAVLRCNTEGVPITGLEIARGTASVDAVPAHLETEPRLLEGSRAPERPASDRRVDYKERALFNLVGKGDVLARLEPERPGSMGANVRGEALPFRTERASKLEAGKNTALEGSVVVATCDGRFERTGTAFSVSPVLQITGTVDYRTGHVKFPGDVVVHGEIQDGFKVHAGGSLLCYETLDASDVFCQKDLRVERGIIGRKEAVVRVGGEVSAKFIENCYLEARGRVFVQVGILNSAVHTLGRLEMGRHGIIVGGRIHAQEGVSAAFIGSSMGPRTEIYCGLDYSVLQRLEYIRAKNMELATKLGGLEIRRKARGTDLSKLEAVEARIRDAIHRLNEAAQALILHLDKNETAEVVVTDTIHPGAYIEICHASFVVTRQMRRVRFSLDKEKGKIRTAPV